MTFEAWLKEQKHREDRIGDLANDFMHEYYVCDFSKTAYKEAHEEWRLLTAKKIEFEWEYISIQAFRAKVFGGWVVKSQEAMVFVPDVNHEWQFMAYA